IARDAMSIAQAIAFNESLLHCTALQYSTGGRRSPFEPLSVANAAALASARERRAALTNVTDDAVEDWYMQLLVRASLRCDGLPDVVDLRTDSTLSGRVCDFMAMDSTADAELTECKRIHPGEQLTASPIAATAQKLLSRLQEASSQLESTYAQKSKQG